MRFSVTYSYFLGLSHSLLLKICKLMPRLTGITDTEYVSGILPVMIHIEVLAELDMVFLYVKQQAEALPILCCLMDGLTSMLKKNDALF